MNQSQIATAKQLGNEKLTDLQKHNAQQREIKFTQLPHRNHDRFLIIDDEVYLLGASVKDMGVGLCAITLSALGEVMAHVIMLLTSGE